MAEETGIVQSKTASKEVASLAKKIAALVKEQQAVMTEEAKLSGGFKRRKMAIQGQIDQLAIKQRIDAALDGLSPEARKAALADAKEN